jgi:polysaccharide export outer membrane protein
MLSLVSTLLIGAPTVLKGAGPQAPQLTANTPEALAASPVSQLGSAEPVGPLAVAGRYRVRQGDTLELIFPFVPAFNQTVAVQPDGYISLRAVGEFHVEGQTVSVLEAALRARYAAILRDPVITIALKDFEKPYFIATGEVERPGKYELRGETTVAQALAIAGGLKDRAKRSHVLVFCGTGGDGIEAKELNLKRVLSHDRQEGDLKLNPGDMVFVPKTHIPAWTTFLPVLYIIPWFFRF